jgi:SAM-dependent methyltransferase
LASLRPVHRLVTAFAAKLLGLLPDPEFKDALSRIAVRRARSAPPADGLRFLLGLEGALYGVLGELAVAYGGGLHTKHRHMRYHEFFVSRIRAGERVLDVGCGVGAVAQDVAEKAGAHVVAVDRSAETIAKASVQHPHPLVEYRVGDAVKECVNGSFDVVILSNVLEHIGERVQFLAGLRDSAQPSRILVRVPLFERDWRIPLKRELGVDWRLDPSHKTEYTLESFAEEMRQAALRITHQEVRWGEIWAEVMPIEGAA